MQGFYLMPLRSHHGLYEKAGSKFYSRKRLWAFKIGPIWVSFAETYRPVKKRIDTKLIVLMNFDSTLLDRSGNSGKIIASIRIK